MSALVSYSESESESESEFFTLPNKDPLSEVTAEPLKEESIEPYEESFTESYHESITEPYHEPFIESNHESITESYIESTPLDNSLQNIPEYAAAMRKKRPLDIVDIRQDDLVGDSWKRAIKDIDPPSNAQTNKFYYSRASEGVLRNNNIRYLAYKAIEQQRELEKKAEYRKALQKESRQKYGF